MKKTLLLIVMIGFSSVSCVEMGKPAEKESEKKSEATSEKVDENKVDHYTCPKGHKGSDKQGTCAECGTVLAHNQAFHANDPVQFPPPAANDPFQNNNANTPPPAQNRFGAYHYICPNGHEGGAGSAAKCVSCGIQLVHNQDYHK